MNIWIGNYIICLLVSLVLAGIIIPNIMTIAFKRKLFDEIDERKIHKGVVPRLGGFSFLPAFLFSFCLVIGCNLRLETAGFGEIMNNVSVTIFFLVCALMLLYLVGIADDLIGVRYRAKFVFQIIAGLLIVISGSSIDSLHGFIGISALPDAVSWIITIFLVLYVVNAINLIDGIDGLASGLSAIALMFYAFLFYQAGDYAYCLLSGAILGTLIPFFYYNVFGKAERHNKIFMGDTGSLTIGLTLAFLSIKVFNMTESSISHDENIFILAIAPIFLPCFDVARVFVHRVKAGRNPFLPDNCHLHHKLLALGFKQSKALIIIILTDAGFIALNLILSPYINPTWILLFDVVLFSALNAFITLRIRAKERKHNVRLYN